MAIFLLHDEEMSNWLGVEHLPVTFSFFSLDSSKLPQGGIHLTASLAPLSGPGKGPTTKGANLRELPKNQRFFGEVEKFGKFYFPGTKIQFFTKNHESHSGVGKFGKKMLV